MADREGIIADLQRTKKTLTDTDFIDADIAAAEQEMTLLSNMIRSCINANAANTLSVTDYRIQYDDLCLRFENAEKKHNELLAQRQQMEREAVIISGLLFEIMELDTLPITFNETLWNATIDRVTVYADERLVFRFKDGTEIAEML